MSMYDFPGSTFQISTLSAALQMGVMIGDAVYSHWDVQTLWHSMLETVWLLCDETQQVWC